jgi:hypothetical protein
MTPDQYATAPRCATCGRTAHGGMGLERVFAAGFNGAFNALCALATLGRRPEATRG